MSAEDVFAAWCRDRKANGQTQQAASWAHVYEPADVPCAGCGEPIPHAVGPDASHGEHLQTPIGRCYRRTHHDPVCIEKSRAAVDGRPVKVAITAQERVAARVRGAGGR